MDQLSGLVVEKQRNAALAERHHHLVKAGRRPYEACSADSKHAAQRRVQLKPDLWEFVLIILDDSVKWEFTAWPRMDMANVAVSHPVLGPRRKVVWDRLHRFL